jgi:hypothetical protein
MLIETVEVAPQSQWATVWVARGYDLDTRAEVWFGVDHRPARDLAGALAEYGDVLCEVEDWQVLRVLPCAEECPACTDEAFCVDHAHLLERHP